MNNHTGELTVTAGTDSIVRLAMIDANGPTGIFIDRLGPLRDDRRTASAADRPEPHRDLRDPG